MEIRRTLLNGVRSLLAKLPSRKRLSKIQFRSQLGQDQWIITQVFPFKEWGYFVDIGASNGVDVNNTYVLEKEFGWKGICVEPGIKFEALTLNRNCLKYNLCITEKSGQIVPFKVDELNPDFSGISQCIDKYSDRKGVVIERTTLSLVDLLKQSNSPQCIDYLSIDTEGSEYLILKDFPFQEFSFGAITVEHNHVEPKRTQLYSLLTRNGYFRAEEIDFEDWYLSKSPFSYTRFLGSRMIKTTKALLRGSL